MTSGPLVLTAALFVTIAAAQEPGAAAGPRCFERILWVGGADPPLPAARVAAAGFTAANLPRGGDPAPLRAAGLGFYVDQPAGKGLLELRDAGFDPLRQDYERRRDPDRLIRPVCLQDEAAVQAAMRSAVQEVARVAGPGLRFVALADEASATRHNNPLDLCRCAACTAAFARFAAARYETIAALNAAWATDFPDFAALRPLSTDQIRRRELGDVLLPRNLRPWSDWLDFVDRQFVAAVAALVRPVAAAVPGTPVGLTGIQPPAAFGGHDYGQLLPLLTLAEIYDIGGARDLGPSLLPATALRYATLFAPAADAPSRLLVAQLARAAAHGEAGVVVWNDAAVFQGTELSPFGQALQRALAELQPILDACAGARIEPADVWLVESAASVRAHWMLDSQHDGATWLRRLSSYEQGHSTSQAARIGWFRLLQDLGLQPQAIAEAELPERLLRLRPRCLVLPACIALHDRTCQAIEVYVRGGGTVLADHGTALYDGHLVRRPAGALDALFGIQQRSLRVEDQRVREGKVTRGGGRTLVAERGLAAQLADRIGDAPVFVERREGRGRAVYLNLAVAEYNGLRLDAGALGPARDLRTRVRAVLQAAGVEPPCDVRGPGLPTCIERVPLRLRDGRSVLAIRVHALDRPALMAELAREGPRSVTVELPRPLHLRRLGAPNAELGDLGTADKFPLALDPFAGLFLEVVR